MSENALNIIYAAIDEVNAESDDFARLDKSPDTALFDLEGKVDSLMLVNLVVAVEGQIQEQTGKTVVLIDESTMALEDSPFKSVGTLAAYIEKLL